VEILQDHDEGSLRRNRFQRFTEFPHHALTRSSEDFALKSLSLAGFHK
jgi:hypothetical protein